MSFVLARATRQTYQTAYEKGALVPIATQAFHIVDNQIKFLVRILTKAQEKKEASSSSQQGKNPFLPYDPNLYVADLTKTHVCLLNKFCVVPLHLLMVTKDFQPQNTLLTREDFEAATLVLSQWEGVCFYNSCKTAGASQQHKHLQFIPFEDNNEMVPLNYYLLTHCQEQQVNALPFVHLVSRLSADWEKKQGNDEEKDIQKKTDYLVQTYYYLLNKLTSQLSHDPQLYPIISDKGKQQQPQDSNPFPYNLIFTRQWMYIVPRSAEEWQGIAVNALGMVGTLLVKNEESLHHLQSVGPLQLLR